LCHPAPWPLQALFRHLLSCPHWAVRAAALDALVLYSRTSAVHSTFLGLIPPACMAGPDAATLAFVAVFKAHMGRSQDEEVGVGEPRGGRAEAAGWRQMFVAGLKEGVDPMPATRHLAGRNRGRGSMHAIVHARMHYTCMPACITH
jgi:hypothetical protein